MKIGLKEFDYKMLCLLLIYMLFHYYICELLLKETSIDNLVRDVVIGILFLSSLRIKRGVRHGLIVGLGIVIMCINATFSYILNSYPGTFNILRTYTVLVFVFYVAAKIDLKEEWFVALHRFILDFL